MRYLPLTDDDRKQMLAAIGARSVNDLYCDVPKKAQEADIDLPRGLSEMAVDQAITAMARKNLSPANAPSFLGGGAYRHHVPAAVDYLIQRGEFLTAYTPYQPEVSQGTLQYLFEFQTQVAMLTGMDVANASMYDGSTATAEAVMMANRVTRRNKAVICGGLHPHYRDVIDTHARFLNFDVAGSKPTATGADFDTLAAMIDDQTSCVVVQNPDVFGNLRDLSPLAEAAHEKGALLVAIVTEVVSLGLVESPGAMGADIVACEGQSIGNALNFGGPHVGLFATKSKYLRQMPGRLTGETIDADGQRGYVLTLSTREQHIRREKATSNICTNSGLCALAFTIHMTALGEAGLANMAAVNHQQACKLADGLSALPGVTLETEIFFNEMTVKLPKAAADVVSALAEKGILGGIPASRLFPDNGDLANHLILAATETNSDQDIDALINALQEVL